MVDASAVTGTLAGSGELEDLRWWGIGEALGMDLAGPQRLVLGRLELWLALSAAERRAQREVPVLYKTDWEME